jgi:hypothetical protein
MTSASIHDPSSPVLNPPGSWQPLRELAGQLGALGLDACIQPAASGQAAHGELLTVTNPDNPRGQVHVTHDGAITWTSHQALRPGHDLASITHAITVILVRPEQRDTSATDGQHALSPHCPLHCLKDMLPPLTFNALDRAMGERFGGHPTVGHVLHMYRNRTLDGIRGMGAKGITQIDTVLRLAGLPTQPYGLGHPASDARQPAPTATLPSLAEVRAEHPGWRIEPTRGHRTFGYTATRHTNPAQVIRTSTLSEMQTQLRQTPAVSEAISPQQQIS